MEREEDSRSKQKQLIAEDLRSKLKDEHIKIDKGYFDAETGLTNFEVYADEKKIAEYTTVHTMVFGMRVKEFRLYSAKYLEGVRVFCKKYHSRLIKHYKH
jgi:hypothetical protein